MGRSTRLLMLCALAAASCGKVSSSSPDAPQTFDSPPPQMVTLTVSLSGTGGGNVSSTPNGIDCGTACTMTVTAGSQVTITAAPDATSTFSGYTGGGCGTAATCTITVSTDTTVSAAFAKMQFTVTVTPGGNGTGTVTSAPTGINCGTSCSQKYDVGTSVTLTAAPDASSTFVGWTGGGCDGTTAPCTFTVSADTNVQASFALNDSLVVTLGGNGTGTVTSNDTFINCGSACTHQYAPNTMVT